MESSGREGLGISVHARLVIPTGEVDFRYTGDVCIMLFMDGHVTTEAKWTDLNELERGRQIRVRGLDQR